MSFLFSEDEAVAAFVGSFIAGFGEAAEDFDPHAAVGSLVELGVDVDRRAGKRIERRGAVFYDDGERRFVLAHPQRYFTIGTGVAVFDDVGQSFVDGEHRAGAVDIGKSRADEVCEFRAREREVVERRGESERLFPHYALKLETASARDGKTSTFFVKYITSSVS